MNTVRFKARDISEKLFVKELKQKVNSYFKEKNISTKANYRMVLKTIVLLCIYIVPFVTLLFLPVNSLTAALLVVVMGFGIAGVGMGVMHDACHGAYSSKKWINDLLSGTLYLLGSNILNWKIQHNILHHTYTNISGLDEDIDNKGPIRLSDKKSFKKYQRFQFIYAFFFYGLMTVTMLLNDFARLYKYHKMGLITTQNKSLKKELLMMFIRKSTYLLVVIGLPLWLTDFSILQIISAFLIMHWVASVILSVVFQLAHVVEGASQESSETDIDTDWSIHQLNTTSDFARKNKLLSWYVGGLNFQIEHHLFPNVCHIHYPALALIVEETAKVHGLHYNLQPTFRSALLSHIQRLKQLGHY